MENSMLEIKTNGIITHKALMDSVHDLIFILDRSGTIIEANNTACKLLGYNHSELMNRKFGSFIAGDLLTNWNSLSVYAHGINCSDNGVRSLLWTKKSELLLVNVWINPQFNESGECMALLVIARTISDVNSKWDAYISSLMNAPRQTSEMKKNMKSTTKPAGSNTAMKKIMVVDDEELIRRIFEDIVSMNFPSIEIDSAESGEEALNKAQDNRYDLVFLDMKMREIDGVETYRRMKNNNPEQKVVILTGYFEEEKSRIAMMDGICGIIYKPFTIEQILWIIEKQLLNPAVAGNS